MPSRPTREPSISQPFPLPLSTQSSSIPPPPLYNPLPFLQSSIIPLNVFLLLFRNLVEYFVGSEERFELSLEIENGGEDAYEAILHLDLPESLSYIKTEVVEGYGEAATVPVLCSPPTHNNNFVLKCDLGNPMAGGSKVNFLPKIMKGLKMSKVFFCCHHLAIFIVVWDIHLNNTLSWPRCKILLGETRVRSYLFMRERKN